MRKEKGWNEEEGAEKEQMEEKDITVLSFSWLANSFQGSRTPSTGPHSKVIALIHAFTKILTVPRRFQTDFLIIVDKICNVNS